MYAHVMKTKVFFIVMPHGRHPDKIKPHRLLVGLDDSAARSRWSLPYVTIPDNNAQGDLYQLAAEKFKAQFGNGLELIPTSPNICAHAVNPATGEELLSVKKDQPIELNIFMIAKLLRGRLDGRNSVFQGLDFYDLDNGREVQKSMLPTLQAKVLKGYQGKGQLPGADKATKMDCTTIGTRLAALMARPQVIDQLTGLQFAA